MKRVFDLAAACDALIVLSPVMATLAVLVRATHGAPALFVQERPGLRGKPFKLIKFRTMKHGTDERGALLPDAQRLTRFGRFLRSSSMDELPELWNVVRGEMSIVGPRPLLMEYLPRYSARQARRHDVRPGITGWAQINGRNAIRWEDKFEMDLWYIEHQSFALDLKIVALTLLQVLRRDGISAAGEATMPAFMGSAPEVERLHHQERS